MLVLTALCTAFLIGWVAWEELQFRNATSFTSSASKEKATSFDKLFSVKCDEMDSFTSDCAYRAGFSQFLSQPDPVWAHINIDEELVAQKLDGIWVFGQDRTLVYAVARPHSQRLQRLVLPAGAFDAIDARRHHVRFFIRRGNDILQISGAIIRMRPPVPGSATGYLLAARILSPVYINSLSYSTNGNVTLTDSLPKNSYSECLYDWAQRPVAWLVFRDESTFLSLLRSSHEGSISLFVAFSLVVLLTAFIAIIRWVSLPLGAITNSLVTEDPRGLVGLARTGTEFGQIAALVMEFFHQKSLLENEITERMKIADELVAAQEQLEKRVEERTAELSKTNRSLNEKIAEIDRAQTALLLAEEKYRSIFENAAEGIFQISSDGRYLGANPALARIYGYDSPEELMEIVKDADVQVFVSIERRQWFRHLIEEKGSVLGFESEVYRKDGSITWISENTRVVRDEFNKVKYYEGTVEDISDRKRSEIEIFRLNAHLADRLDRIEALRRIDSAISTNHDLTIILQAFLKEVKDQLKVDAAAVLLRDAGSPRLKYAAFRGFRSRSLHHASVSIGDTLAGRAVQTQRNVTMRRLDESKEQQPASHYQEEGFVSYFAVPLITRGEVKGVLEVFHRSELTPDHEWSDFLEALAGQAAIAIENTTLLAGLQHSNVELSVAYDATIEGWSRALDLRDKETEGHSQRVTQMTIRLAAELGVSDEELVHVRRGALLHDIGKMGIPDQILLKPGPLTDDEWVIMRKHPVYAYEMLDPIEFLGPAMDIPYAHHEKWDGTGYPRGLKGEEIPLAARAFAIIDVWDALCSDRPYRPGWPIDRVREHIQKLSGTHFDPAVVEAFLRMIDDVGYEPPLPIAA